MSLLLLVVALLEEGRKGRGGREGKGLVELRRFPFERTISLTPLLSLPSV